MGTDRLISARGSRWFAASLSTEDRVVLEVLTSARNVSASASKSGKVHPPRSNPPCGPHPARRAPATSTPAPRGRRADAGPRAALGLCRFGQDATATLTDERRR